MKVGFVGLGTMGLPMAGHLIRGGHDVSCCSRSPGPVVSLEAMGARGLSSPEDVVSCSEVTFLCLPDDEAVVGVVRRCLPMVAGRAVVDCSTVAPVTEVMLAREVQAGGGAYLDAPVSGGPSGARAGTLSVMVGGDPEVYQRVKEVLALFAGYLDLVGDTGAGQVVKLCNQAIVGAQLLAIAECVELVRRAGIEPSRLHGALVHSTADCIMARTRFPVPGVVAGSPASDGWRPDFTTDLMAKDLRIASEFAARHGLPMTSLPVLADLLTRSGAEGNGPRDWSSFANLLGDVPR